MCHRFAASSVTPWIERLILSYSGREERAGGFLKAHVIGLGQMTESQALGCEGPTDVLFLSDGLVRIPAVLTAAAWEDLQEQEDRDDVKGLLNDTMLIQDYQLLFHMAKEQTKCWFYLSVRKLGTVAAGPRRELTLCYTSLPSVRMKINQTWQTLLVEENVVWSQSESDLSLLLEAWQQDDLQDVQQEIRERLMAGSPQPSTSAHRAAGTRLRTGWDVDRIRYKGEEEFTVPGKCLLIPEEVSQQAEALAGTGGASHPVTGGDPPQAPGCDAGGSSSDCKEDSPLYEFIVTDSDDFPLSNPWDAFPPPCVSSSSSISSRETTPNLPERGAAASDPDAAAMVTSTQLPVNSDLPPYQKQPTSFPSLPTTSGNPPEPPTSDDAAQQNCLVLTRTDEDDDQEHDRKPKRKRCDVTAEPGVPGQEELSGSPPSWLFDSTGTSRTEEPSTPSTEPGLRKILNTHSDGRPFMYSYKVSGQNLQDLRGFRVAASLLQWAVKYLVTPRQNDSAAHGV